MATRNLYVLADDIQFIPVSSLPAQTKEGFEHLDDDVVITHSHTRKTSKVINSDAMGLLQEFRKPMTWVEGIIRFAVLHQRDPQAVAEDSFALLEGLKQQGFLVSYEEAGKPRKVLEPGDTFGKYLIKKNYQALADTEVYQVEDQAGKNYALKLMRLHDPDGDLLQLFKNEAELLCHLDGTVNPAFIEAGLDGDPVYLLTEWCEGLTSDQAAAARRNFNDRNNLIRLLDLCIGIIQGYDHLHRQGVFHVDIHPRNILVTSEGRVRIIDYGISTRRGSAYKRENKGVAQYYEPEFAAAILKGEEAPPSTEKGEQYSVAALIYFLLTEQSYVNFSFERQKLFHQILHEQPRPLRVYDLNLPVSLDGVLATALCKDPDKRFPDMLSFANALQDVRNSILSGTHFFILGKEKEEDRLVQFLIRKFGFDSLFIKEGLVRAPACSVNYGAAGIAYMFYRMACVRDEPELMNLADVWAGRAAAYSTMSANAFYSTEFDLTEKTVGRRSLYHSPTGVWLVQALVSQCGGDLQSLHEALQSFLVAAGEPCDKIDLTLGKSSLLIACSMILCELQILYEPLKTAVKALAEGLLREIWDEIDGYPSMNKPNPVDYYGIAHGWAGLLYATLLWCRASGRAVPAHFDQRVSELRENAIRLDDAITWPTTLAVRTSMPGWCHGSAGYIFLWSLLYRHYNDEGFLFLAENTANQILRQAEFDNGSLCCGMAGEAYALLNLYRLTKNQRYLDGAHVLKQLIFRHIANPILKNNSLYKGEVGLGVLMVELDRPEFARMPLFE
jgi:hypothetical protein